MRVSFGERHLAEGRRDAFIVSAFGNAEASSDAG